MKTMMKTIGAFAAVLVLSSAGMAQAQSAAAKATVDAAKVSGVVGEQADGYLGFHTPSSDIALQAAVTTTNAARRSVYAASAAQAGTTADVAGARMFETQLLPRISSGQWYRNASGQWVRR